MKNIIIILVLAAALGAAGFFITAETMRRRQNAANPAPAPTGNSAADWTNAIRMNTQASGDLAKRQNAAFAGAGVGAGIGVLAGILIAMRSKAR